MIFTENPAGAGSENYKLKQAMDALAV